MPSRRWPGTATGLVLAGLLASTRSAAIANGEPPTDARFATDSPWAVVLVRDDGPVICTGSLISPRFVLTAAHCAGDGLSVLFGFLFFNVLWGLVWWGVKSLLLRHLVGFSKDERKQDRRVGPLAQLDRASDYESEGQRFKSSRAR